MASSIRYTGWPRRKGFIKSLNGGLRKTSLNESPRSGINHAHSAVAERAEDLRTNDEPLSSHKEQAALAEPANMRDQSACAGYASTGGLRRAFSSGSLELLDTPKGTRASRRSR